MILDTAERQMLYAFLSVIFRRPDEQTVAAVEGVEADTFAAVFPGLGTPPKPTLDELRESYGHLFVGSDEGVPVPPYGSYYLEKPRRDGRSARLVANLYASAGLEPDASEAPDYLAAELEFLYYLSEGEAQSREKKIDSLPQRWVASQADFFHNFFAPWIDPFCARIAENRESHPFYRWAAELLHRFVALEKERLKAVV